MTLPLAAAACTLQTVDVDAEVARLDRIATVMRAHGVSRYGDIEMGPAPTSTSEPEDAKRPDAATREIRAREQRRAIAMAGSGGPLKRVDADQ